MDIDNEIKLISLNCHGCKGNTLYINNIITTHDIIFLSETWLLQSESHLIHNYKLDFELYFTPAKVELSGRPYGGNIMLVRKSTNHRKIELILQEDFTALIKIDFYNTSVLLCGVYLQSISKKSDHIKFYQNQLSIINGILEKFESTSEYIILGDFQCCPSAPNHHASGRAGKTNHLSPWLDDFITKLEAYPIDIYEATGPAYTYQHATLPNQSYIDHIIVSGNIAHKLSNTAVHPPSFLNTGDHIPISAALTVDHKDSMTEHSSQSYQNLDFLPNYVWQNQKFIEHYKNITDAKLHNLADTNDPSKYIVDIQSILKQSALQAHTELNDSKQFHFFKTKCWWNPELSKKKKTLQNL